eukprot:4353356-Alexandrium_andersonii.AAC.1
MSASLVGSEMCIRDSPPPNQGVTCSNDGDVHGAADDEDGGDGHHGGCGACLLYTSDAADDM